MARKKADAEDTGASENAPENAPDEQVPDQFEGDPFAGGETSLVKGRITDEAGQVIAADPERQPTPGEAQANRGLLDAKGDTAPMQPTATAGNAATGLVGDPAKAPARERLFRVSHAAYGGYRQGTILRESQFFESADPRAPWTRQQSIDRAMELGAVEEIIPPG
jgi:hypothetical protein